MMDPESTKARNEIMRRIKMYQMKERNMPNFVRKKREELLSKVIDIDPKFVQRINPLDNAAGSALSNINATQPPLPALMESKSKRQSLSLGHKKQSNSSGFGSQLSAGEKPGPQASVMQTVSEKQDEEDQMVKIKAEFVDYVTEILTKTTTTSGSAAISQSKGKHQKLSQMNLIEEVTYFLREGRENR